MDSLEYDFYHGLTGSVASAVYHQPRVFHIMRAKLGKTLKDIASMYNTPIELVKKWDSGDQVPPVWVMDDLSLESKSPVNFTLTPSNSAVEYWEKEKQRRLSAATSH